MRPTLCFLLRFTFQLASPTMATPTEETMFAADLSPVDLSHEEERPATPSQVGHVLPEELNLLKAFSDARAMVNKVEEKNH